MANSIKFPIDPKSNKELQEVLKVTDQIFTNLEKISSKKIVIQSSKQLAKEQAESNKQTQTATDLTKQLTKAKNDLATAQSKDGQELIKLRAEKAKLNAETRKEYKLNSAGKDSYERLSLTLDKARLAAKDLAVKFGENSKQFLDAQKDVVSLDQKLKSLDSSLGINSRTVGDYKGQLINLEKELVAARLNLERLTTQFGENDARTINASKSVTNLTEKHKVLNTTINNFNTTNNSYSKSMTNIGKTSTLATRAVNGLKAALLPLAALFGVTQLISYGKELNELGNRIKGIDFAFNRLGVNGADALDRIKKSTRGLISNLDIKKSLVEFDNFNISLEQTDTLFEFLAVRATQTGESIDSLKSSLVEGLSKESKLRIDNLGISTEQLNKELEKTPDFVQAVANIAKTEVAKAGSILDEAASSQQKWSVSIDDTNEMLARLTKPAFDLFFKGINFLLFTAVRYFTDLGKKITEFKKDIGRLLANLSPVTNAFGSLFNRIRDIIKESPILTKVFEYMKTVFIFMVAPMKGLVKIFTVFVAVINGTTKSIKSFGSNALTIFEALKKLFENFSLKNPLESFKNLDINGIKTAFAKVGSESATAFKDGFDEIMKNTEIDVASPESVEDETKKKSVEDLTEKDKEAIKTLVEKIEALQNERKQLQENAKVLEEVAAAESTTTKNRGLANKELDKTSTKLKQVETDLINLGQSLLEISEFDYTEMINKFADASRDYISQRVDVEIEIYNAKVDAINKELISEEEKKVKLIALANSTNAELERIQESAVDGLLRTNIDYLKKRLDTEKLTDDEIKRIKDDIFAYEDVLRKKNLDKIKADGKEQVEAVKVTEEEKKNITKQITDSAFQVVSMVSAEIFAQQNARFDEQMALAKKAADYEILLAEQSGESAEAIGAKKLAISEQLARKEAEIRRKQAKAQKEQAIFNAVIATAVGVVAQFQAGPAGIALAAITAALGAVQIALIASRPIPKFKKGVENFEGGKAIVGDGGREFVRLPNKEMLLFERETMVNLPKGSDVIKNSETEKILKAQNNNNKSSNFRPQRTIVHNHIINRIGTNYDLKRRGNQYV